MSLASKGECEIVLGGVKRTLSLKIGDFEELESRLNCGIEQVIERLRMVRDGDDEPARWRMPDWRITDARVIIQLALERSGWRAPSPDQRRAATPQETRDEVLRMMLKEGMGVHAASASQILASALGELPGGNASAPAGGSEPDKYDGRFPIRRYLELGGMMGWRPYEVRECAIPEFLAALDGFLEFHGSTAKPEPEAMSRERLEELMLEYPDK